MFIASFFIVRSLLSLCVCNLHKSLGQLKKFDLKSVYYVYDRYWGLVAALWRKSFMMYFLIFILLVRSCVTGLVMQWFRGIPLLVCLGLNPWYVKQTQDTLVAMNFCCSFVMHMFFKHFAHLHTDGSKVASTLSYN